MTRGIVLIACGEPFYGHMTYQLAVSLRVHSPGIEIALIYSDTAVGDIPLSMFDHLIPAPEESYTVNGRRVWLKVKTHLAELSPFDSTIFLDADMITFRDINTLFDQLAEVEFTMENNGFIELEADVTNEKYTWASPFEIKLAFKLLSGRLYSLQSEFIYFRKKPEVKKLFTEAQKVYKSRINYREFSGGMADELAFAVAMAKKQIYPHQDHYLPIYWETAQKKKLYRHRNELMENYYGFSLGGHINSEYSKQCYFDIANYCWQKLGLRGKPMVKDKRKIIPGRENA